MNRVVVYLAGITGAVMCLAMSLVTVSQTQADASRTTPADAIRSNPPAVRALTNARIVARPGMVIERGTVVVRDGVIAAVGANVAPPAGARIHDMDGKTIYPGLIDAYGEIDIDADDEPQGGARHWNAMVRPERRAADHFQPSAAVNRKLRSQGITARLIAPADGIVKGVSAVVTTGDDPSSDALVKADTSLHLRMTPRGAGGRFEGGPTSPMGAVALLRQVMLDAQWYTLAWQAATDAQAGSPPEKSISFESLNDWLTRRLPVVIDTSNHLYALRGARLADEFKWSAVIRGSGREYRRLDEIAKCGYPVLLPLNFPKAPNVATPEAASAVSLADLMHWDIAPENPGRLAAAGVTIALTTDRLDDAAGFLKAVRQAVKRGLPENDALEAITLAPAKIFGVDDQLGSIRSGRRANLLVTDGNLFDDKTRVMETWVDGKRYEITSPTLLDARGDWQLVIHAAADQHISHPLIISGQERKLKAAIKLPDDSDTDDAPDGNGSDDKDVDDDETSEAGKPKKKKSNDIALIKPTVDRRQFTARFRSDKLGYSGVAMLSATLTGNDDHDDDGYEVDRGLGRVVWPDGTSSAIELRRTIAESVAVADAKNDKSKEGKSKKDDKASEDKAAKTALYPVNYPLGAYGRSGPPAAQRSVVFKHATIWTSAEQGIIEDGWLLIQHGKIRGIGQGNVYPDADVTIDATGMHLTPGLIDCHSHIATDGGINEVGQAITAEVRIGDFIDSADMSIYRQLAGGTTSANILHGSANAIGGQNQVVKFRWGASDEQLKFDQAPQGIKFALGENPKRSNFQVGTPRYPQTRMGVEQIIRDEFRAASEYAQRWSQWQATGHGIPPRRDLELDAVVEILKGDRLIHCHAYRQDEMLALMRTCEEFNVRIATFQHVLEGYKIADAMARHGAGGSSFSDWWGYKFEVYDAIPHNGALMHNAGVVVSFNSDDDEMARRLNLEAAKAVRYGGVSPEEALKFVTLNPAKQLRIDKWVGSLEIGKDGDIVLWTASPLSVYTKVQQTWIDGRKYFDLAEHDAQRAEINTMRAAMIQRIIDADAPMTKPGAVDPLDLETLWPRHDVFCGAHDDDHGHGHGHGHAHEHTDTRNQEQEISR